MFKRFAIVLSVAFLFVGSGFWCTPAQADWNVGIGNATGACVQFDWRGGTATYSGSGDGVFTVDVNNTIDNRIGGGSMADSWSIWVNDSQVVQSDVIAVSQPSVPVSGDWTVTVQGIDRGFWAGWYGTVFCNPSFSSATPVEPIAPIVEPTPEPIVTPEPTPEPTVEPSPEPAPEPVYTPAPQPTGDYRLNEGFGTRIVAPAGMVIDHVVAWYGDPNDGSRGADWSAQYTEQLHGLTEADLNSGNFFGDPLPGVYKVLVASVLFMPDPALVVIPEPTPTPIPEPVVVPAPQPIPTPVEPAPQPVEPPIVPVIEPEPVIIPEPTPEPVEQPVDTTPTPIEQPVEPVTPVESEIIPEPIVEPVVEPVKPVDTPKVETPVEQPQIVNVPVKLDTTPSPTQELQQLAEAAQQDDVEVPAEIADIPILGGAAVAIVDTFNALGNLGADMRPEVRATAKKEVIAAVIVGQVAQTASMVASSGAAIRRRIN